MKVRSCIVLLTVVLSPGVARAADAKFYPFGENSTSPLVPGLALEKGAVYELKVRIGYDKMDNYLAEYARWYLPVDQSTDSGRKLLSILAREHGDEYNLVFLYHYDDAWKKGYYQSYRRAFFQFHKDSLDTRAEFQDFYRAARKDITGDDYAINVDMTTMIGQTLCAFVDGCTVSHPEVERAVGAETIRKIDLYFAKMVDLEERSWNFGVSSCAVRALQVAKKKGKLPLTNLWLAEQCPEQLQSILQRDFPGSNDWDK